LKAESLTADIKACDGLAYEEDGYNFNTSVWFAAPNDALTAFSYPTSLSEFNCGKGHTNNENSLKFVPTNRGTFVPPPFLMIVVGNVVTSDVTVGSNAVKLEAALTVSVAVAASKHCSTVASDPLQPRAFVTVNPFA
jgi:hypothetical protein